MTFNSDLIESLYRQCYEKVFADYGLHLDTIRDLHTGAPIGEIFDEIFHTALIDEGALDDSEDGETISIETFADALLVRSLASARPSPALNHPTTQSLTRLLKSDPRTVCAYLLNRYALTHWRKLNHRDDSWFDDMLHRVKVWEKLERLTTGADSDANERSLRALAHWLLELDSKCNLHELTPLPGWFDVFHSLETVDQFELFVSEFALIATPLIVEADKRFAIGNRMTGGAYLKSYFDNPVLEQRKVEIANKRRQRLYDKYGDVELGALLEEEKLEAAKLRSTEKQKKDSRIIKGRSSRGKSAKLINKHSDMLRSLFKTLDEVVTEPKAATPEPVKATGLPRFVKG